MLPLRKHLCPCTKNAPRPNRHRRTVFVRDWIFWNFLRIWSLKNQSWAFSEPSPNWAKSHWREQQPLITTLDTREWRETVEKLSEKVFRTYDVFCFFNRFAEKRTDYLYLNDFWRSNKVQTRNAAVATVHMHTLWCPQVSHKSRHPQWALQ